MIEIKPHPLLDAICLEARFNQPLGKLTTPPWLTAKLGRDAESPIPSDDQVKRNIRELLRAGGYRPSGRGKPASEYLLRSADAGRLDSINLAVDVCNVVSLHSGLPISVIDLDKVTVPLSIAVAGVNDQYVFNPSGQTIKLSGLLCLCDCDGPCGSPVKDSQRTRTDGRTVRTLSVIWGTRALPDRSVETAAWYRELLLKLDTDSRMLATTTRPTA